MIRFMTSRPSSRTIGKPPVRLRQLLPTAAMMLVIIGLTYQSLQGNRGVSGWQDLQRQRAAKQHELTALQQANDDLQQQIARLSGDTLDYDFLDERARKVLGLVGPDEVVVFNQHLRRN
jgi:cell division protein FtsB